MFKIFTRRFWKEVTWRMFLIDAEELNMKFPGEYEVVIRFAKFKIYQLTKKK